MSYAVTNMSCRPDFERGAATTSAATTSAATTSAATASAATASAATASAATTIAATTIAAKCDRREGALLRSLKVASGAKTPLWEVQTREEAQKIQALVLRYSGFEAVIKLTQDLPSSADFHQIDDLLELAKLKPTNFPFRVQVISKEEWITCFGESALAKLDLTFGRDLSPFILNSMREIFVSLKEMSHINIEKNAGFTVISSPAGLTFDKTRTLVAEPQPGRQPVVIHSFSDAIEPFINVPIKGYLKVISNGLIENSRVHTFQELKQHIEENGCELPHTIDAFNLVCLKYIIDPSDRILSRLTCNDVSATMCTQPFENNTIASVVGEFNPKETQMGPLTMRELFCYSNTFGALIAATLYKNP